MTLQVEKLSTYTGHTDCVYTLVKGKGSLFYSAGADGMVVQWDLNKPDTGELMIKLPNSVYALCLLENSSVMAVGNNYTGVHLVDIAEKKELRSAAITQQAIFHIEEFGPFLFCGTSDGVLIVLDKQDLSVVKKISVSDKSLRAIAKHPLKPEIAIASSDNYIYIVELSDLSISRAWQAHKLSVFSLAYSPEGDLLYSSSRDAHIKSWDAEGKYDLVNDVPAHLFAINHISLIKGAKFMSSVSMDKSIKIWQLPDLKLLKVIDKARHAGHGTSVNRSLWFESEGLLITCSDDRLISVWNINFGL